MLPPLWLLNIIYPLFIVIYVASGRGNWRTDTLLLLAGLMLWALRLRAWGVI